MRSALRASGTGPLDKAFEGELAGIRQAGLARAVDAVLPGVSGLAAPVFDGNGHLVLSLTAIGATAHFDTRLQGAPAQALQRCAAELSAQLGAPAAVTNA